MACGQNPAADDVEPLRVGALILRYVASRVRIIELLGEDWSHKITARWAEIRLAVRPSVSTPQASPTLTLAYKEGWHIGRRVIHKLGLLVPDVPFKNWSIALKEYLLRSLFARCLPRIL